MCHIKQIFSIIVISTNIISIVISIIKYCIDISISSCDYGWRVRLRRNIGNIWCSWLCRICLFKIILIIVISCIGIWGRDICGIVDGSVRILIYNWCGWRSIRYTAISMSLIGTIDIRVYRNTWSRYTWWRTICPLRIP